MNRLRLHIVLIALFPGASALAPFVLMGAIRGINATSADFGVGSPLVGGLALGFSWIWTCAATPFRNANSATWLAIMPHCGPIETLAVVLPTARRVPLGVTKRETPLMSSGYDAASGHAHFVQDVGIWGATIAAARYVYTLASPEPVMHAIFGTPLFNLDCPERILAVCGEHDGGVVSLALSGTQKHRCPAQGRSNRGVEDI